MEELCQHNGGRETIILIGEDAPRTPEWILGQLWNCTDTVPGDVFEDVQAVSEQFGLTLTNRSYATAARRLKYLLKRHDSFAV